MDMLDAAGDFFMTVFRAVYHVLWGDLITIPLPGGSSLGISLLVLILIMTLINMKGGNTDVD